MALTLVEAAKQETGNVHRQGVIEMFAQGHPLLAAIPFQGIEGNAYSYEQEETLPGVGFRGVNEGFSEDAGVLNPLTERLVIAGGDLDVDRFIVNTQGPGQRAARVAMKVKNLAHTIAHKFIKGDSETDPKEFEGLQKRLGGNQLIENGSSDGGDVLSLAKLDEVIDAVDDPTHLLMSKPLRRLLTVAARTTSVGGQIDYVLDDFGKQVTRYNGLPIMPMDASGMVNATLAFNELGSTGSTATATSIYCIALREGMLQGLDNGGIDARDLGELDSKSVYRTRIEWFVAIALLHGRAAARLRGIKTGVVAV